MLEDYPIGRIASSLSSIEQLLLTIADKDQVLRFTMMWLLYGEANSAENLDEIYRRNLHQEPLAISPVDLYMNDVLNANLLLSIIMILGKWPHKGIVRPEAAFAAWLIAQHADPTPVLQEFFLKKILECRENVEEEYITLLGKRIAAKRLSN